MKKEISALIDGELFEDEAEVVFDRIKRDAITHRDWTTYHLIGDVLRQPDSIHRDISAMVRERLLYEPTVLAPRSQAFKQKSRVFALSAAASLMAVGVVAWMSFQISPEAPVQMAMQQGALRPASLKVQSQSNAYLIAHQEFSPNADMNSGISYMRTVSYSAEEQAR